MTSDRQPTARTRRSEPFPSFQDRPPEVGPKREAVVASLAPSADLVSARSAKESQARASRQNGARSRGPKTAAGKARSAGNALKHGLRARQLVLLEDEDATEFRRFARALEAELMPAGRLQADLVDRIVMAAWRTRRADKLEAGVLASYLEGVDRADSDPRALLAPSAASRSGPTSGGRSWELGKGGRRGVERLATGLSRDNYGPRALATLVRYRGSVLAELFRSLAALKMVQAETRQRSEPARRPAAAALATTKRTREGTPGQGLGS